MHLLLEALIIFIQRDVYPGTHYTDTDMHICSHTNIISNISYCENANIFAIDMTLKWFRIFIC